MNFRKSDALFLIAVILMTALCSCKTPKLSEANEQFGRGEYFNASKTYRAVYKIGRAHV